MKVEQEHRVPLADNAPAILVDARELADGSGLVFPDVKGGAIGGSALGRLLIAVCIGAVPHGFQSSLGDWAAERTNASRGAADAASAHVPDSRVEADYRRTDCSRDAEHRVPMDQWAIFISADEHGLIVPMVRTGAGSAE